MYTTFDKSKLSSMVLSPRLYCLVSTSSADVIGRLRAWKDDQLRFEEIPTSSPRKRFLLATRRQGASTVISSAVINDQGDYDLSLMAADLLAGTSSGVFGCDSEVSLACADEHFFGCSAGFWAFNTHYWHRDEETFVCGSNIFLVAAVTDAVLCEQTFYDYLFFSIPRLDHTWFKDVHCLMPGQRLRVDLHSHDLKIDSGTDFGDLLDSPHRDLIETVNGYFASAKKVVGPDKTNYISLSSGSDSRTVLSCLRAQNMKPHAASFGNFGMLETKAVCEFTHSLRMPWLFVDIEDFDSRFLPLFVDGAFFSSGLINPLRTHYVWYYSHLRRGNALFEGILGSEFVKGEIAVPAMTSGLYHEVIARGGTVAGAIDRNYPELPAEYRRNLADYIQSVYGADLLDVNTEAGFRKYQTYLLSEVPRKIFSGVVSVAMANDITPYCPFLSPKILGAVFSNGAGLRHSVSVRRDHVGPVVSLKAEALIVKQMDAGLYTSLLDRAISFRDVLEGPKFAEIKRRARGGKKRLRGSKLYGGQIDNARVVAKLRDPALDLRCPIIPGGLTNATGNDLLAKAIVNYSWIDRIAHTIMPR